MALNVKNATIVFVAMALLSLTGCGRQVNASTFSEDSNAIPVYSETNSKVEEMAKTTTVSTFTVPRVTTMVTVESTKPQTTTEVVTTTQTTVVETSQVATECTTTQTTAMEVAESYIPLEELQISFDMDVSKPTGLSKEDFVKLIDNLPYDKYGYFSRNAEVFWEECNEKQVNEIFACGIAAWESGWGKTSGFGKNNYFGIRGGSYSTEEEGVKALVNLLSSKYLNENGSCYNGKTITGVGFCYCDANVWPNKVHDCMQMIAAGSK